MTVSNDLPQYYHDVKSLAPLKRAAREDPQDRETLRKVVQQFESIFMAMALKSMRAASRVSDTGESLFDSKQTLFYRDMFDRQLSVKLAGEGGLGLADLMVEQLSTIPALSRPDPFASEQGARYGGLPLSAQQLHTLSLAGQPQHAMPQSLAIATVHTPTTRTIATETQGNTADNIAKTHSARSQVAAKVERPLPERQITKEVTREVAKEVTSEPLGREQVAEQVGQASTEQVAQQVGQASPAEQVAEQVGRASPEGLWHSPTEFVRAIWPGAQQAAKQLGVDPKVLVAQSALETGWGSKLPQHADGRSSFNLFGIKAGSDWHGERVTVNTLEFEGDRFVTQKSAFRAYASVADAMADYTDFLHSRERYADALKNAGSPEKYTHALQKAGYATDPVYADKILRVMQSQPIREGVAKWGAIPQKMDGL